MSKQELLEHICSPASLRPKDDALLFQELVRATGGPDTAWAVAVRAGIEKDNDPLRQRHGREMAQRSEARGRAIADTLHKYGVARERATNPKDRALLERHESRDLKAIYKAHELDSFVSWAAKQRHDIGDSQALRRPRSQRQSRSRGRRI